MIGVCRRSYEVMSGEYFSTKYSSLVTVLLLLLASLTNNVGTTINFKGVLLTVQ